MHSEIQGFPWSHIIYFLSLSLSLHLKMELKMIEQINAHAEKNETSNCWTSLGSTYFSIQHPPQKRHL